MLLCESLTTEFTSIFQISFMFLDGAARFSASCAGYKRAFNVQLKYMEVWKPLYQYIFLKHSEHFWHIGPAFMFRGSGMKQSSVDSLSLLQVN